MHSMTRKEHLLRVLDDFRTSYPETNHLTLETVWRWNWTAQEARAFNRRSGWRKGTGIYFFVDFCAGTDIHTEAADERFSVIRRIGKAEYSFADRINDYCHRAIGDPGARFTWYKAGGDYHEWFRYSQIDIIPATAKCAAVLERFLLGQIPSQYNDKDVPASLNGRPHIYDALDGSERGTAGVK